MEKGREKNLFVCGNIKKENLFTALYLSNVDLTKEPGLGGL